MCLEISTLRAAIQLSACRTALLFIFGIFSFSARDHNLIALEIVNRHHWPKVRFLLPRIKAVSHSIPIRQILSISRRIFLPVKTNRLLIQEEYVAMRTTSRWRRRTNIVRDERLCSCQRWRSCGRFQSGLDPVEDGTEDIEGYEGGVDVESDYHIDFGKVRYLQGKFRWRLSI